MVGLQIASMGSSTADFCVGNTADVFVQMAGSITMEDDFEGHPNAGSRNLWFAIGCALFWAWVIWG